MSVLDMAASSEVQGDTPTFPLSSVANKIITDYLLLIRTFSNVTFVSFSLRITERSHQEYFTFYGFILILLRVHEMLRRTRILT